MKLQIFIGQSLFPAFQPSQVHTLARVSEASQNKKKRSRGRAAMQLLGFNRLWLYLRCYPGVTPTKKALTVISCKGLFSLEPAKRLELLTC